jgi:hypothetical protein
MNFEFLLAGIFAVTLLIYLGYAMFKAEDL